MKYEIEKIKFLGEKQKEKLKKVGFWSLVKLCEIFTKVYRQSLNFTIEEFLSSRKVQLFWWKTLEKLEA